MNEIIIMILLSITFTFSAFIIAQAMIKKIRITNAKNRFVILFIVFLTAFSIYSFAFIPAASNNDLIESTNSNIFNDEYSSLIVMVEETDILEENELNEKYSIINSDNKIINNMNNDLNYPYLKITTFISKLPGNYNILYNLINQYQISNNQITQIDENELDQMFLSKEIDSINNKNNTNDIINIFYIANIILLILGLIYFIFSFFIGKKLILRKYNAKECEDPLINEFVLKISSQLKIKNIKIYLYDGNPNAFVFGFPNSIAISNKLIKYLSKKELESAIKHELAHIKNNDIYIKPFLQVLRILFFYNPVIHIVYYMIMKERELMADSQFIKSKEEKIALIETLIKIYKYSNQKNVLANHMINSYSLSLLPYRSKNLEISDRFNHLFGNNVKKTLYTILICSIILISNISMVGIAGKIIDNNRDNNLQNEIIIENVDIDNKNIEYNHVKHVFRVFEDNHPELYKKCVIYYVLIDIKNNYLSPRDLVDTIRLILND